MTKALEAIGVNGGFAAASSSSHHLDNQAHVHGDR
jgi:hypothetical protein